MIRINAQVIWAGAVEDPYPDMMAICFRHKTGAIVCPVFRIGICATDAYIPKQLSAMFETNKLTAGKKAPFHALAGSSSSGSSEPAEVLSQTPWFVGKVRVALPMLALHRLLAFLLWSGWAGATGPVRGWWV